VIMPTKKKTQTKAKSAKGRDLVITRFLDAPREKVWKAWTEPDEVKKWWGPAPFTSPSARIDLRVGGRYLLCMRSPEGKDYWSTGVYREIVPNERLVYTDSFADEKGRVVPATHYGLSGDFPLEMRVTVTFGEHGGKTKMTLRHEGLPAGEMTRLTGAGWNSSLDKLAESLRGEGGMKLTLPTDREVVVTRVLDAPRDRVFQAYVDPKAIPEWWGPRSFTTRVDRMDVRPGGAWRFVNVGPDGQEHGFHGVFREIRPPERLTWTFEYEGAPGHVSVETITFEELRGGKTKVTVTARFDSQEDRDGKVNAGMEWGMRESYERLEELLNRDTLRQ